tara:strand:- start:288 stop:473 length:186 start_codon:yes stop_codon:yes gene_type:complete
MENKNYVTVKEAVIILETTRQSVHYLRKHGILKDVIQVHATCFLYSELELLELKKNKSQIL